MATTKMEKNIRTGAKSVQGLGVGSIYFYSPETAKDSYAEQGIDDDNAVAIGSHLDSEAEGDATKLRSIIASNGRVKSPRNGAWYTVKSDSSGRVWILNT